MFILRMQVISCLKSEMVQHSFNGRLMVCDLLNSAICHSILSELERSLGFVGLQQKFGVQALLSRI